MIAFTTDFCLVLVFMIVFCCPMMFGFVVVFRVRMMLAFIMMLLVVCNMARCACTLWLVMCNVEALQHRLFVLIRPCGELRSVTFC